MKLSQVEWGTVAKAAIGEYGEKKDDVPGLAAEMAYWVVFSIFPFFIFLATMIGVVGKFVGTDELRSTLSQTLLGPLPATTRASIEGPLNNLLNAGGGALSLGAIVSVLFALNSASTAVLTTMKAFNRAYGVEETRGFIAKRLTAIGLTVVLVFLMVGGALFLSFGGKLIDLLGLGGVGAVVLRIAQLIGPVIGISLGLAILYWKGPNLKQQFQLISPGSIVATLTLLLLSFLFGQYVTRFGESSYSKTYGTAAGVILFLFFLRLASTVVLLGAEFNAEAAKRYDPEAIRDKVTDPNKMLPGQQPMPHPQALREAGVSGRQVAESNTRGAQKLARGQVPTAAAMAAHTTATGGGGGAAPAYQPEDFDDPTVEERLRQIRERPFVSAREQASTAQIQLPAGERAQRARKTVTAFAVSAAAAIGGVLFGTRRGTS